MTRYRRVVVKLSGGALAGEEPIGLDSRALELGADALLVAKQGVDGVYSADPRTDPAAERFERLSYEEAIARDLRVMDPSAFVLARDHGLPLHVFAAERREAMAAIVAGEDVGTTIASA